MQNMLVALWSRNTPDATHGGLSTLARASILANALDKMMLILERQNIPRGQKIRGIFVAPEYYFSHLYSGTIAIGAMQERSLSEIDKNTIVDTLKAISARHPGILIVPGTIAWKKSFTRAGEHQFQKDPATGRRTTTPKVLSRSVKASRSLRRAELVMGGDPAGGAQDVDDALEAAFFAGSNNNAAFKQRALRNAYPLKWPSVPVASLVYNPGYDADVEDFIYDEVGMLDTFVKHTLSNQMLRFQVCRAHNISMHAFNEIPTTVQKQAMVHSHEYLMRNTAYVCLDGEVRFKYAKRGDFHEAIGANQDTVFIPGRRIGAATIEGITFGFEICLDHNLGFLAKSRLGAAVDIHIVSSAAVENNPNNMPVHPGGYYLHASSTEAWTAVYQNVRGQMRRLFGPAMGELTPPEQVSGDKLRCWRIQLPGGTSPDLAWDHSYGDRLPMHEPWDKVPLLPRDTFVTRLRTVFDSRKETMKRSGMRCWVVAPKEDAAFALMVEQLAREWKWWRDREGVRLTFARNVKLDRFPKPEVRIYTQ